MRSLLISAVLGLSLAAVAPSVTSAQTASAAKPAAMTTAAKPAAAMTMAKPASAMTPAKSAAKGGGVKAADRTPISKACSAQADAKKLHGNDRQKFRADCMKKG